MVPELTLAAVSAALQHAGLLDQHVGELPERATGITDDSRQVRGGMVFIAVRGSERDGHDYLE